MAVPAPMQLKVRVPENEEVARCLHEKRLSMREQPAGFKEHLDRTFAKAYRNVCAANEPIRTLKEFSKIKYQFFPPTSPIHSFLSVAE
jgi:crossover junction endonuclease MUS81